MRTSTWCYNDHINDDNWKHAILFDYLFTDNPFRILNLKNYPENKLTLHILREKAEYDGDALGNNRLKITRIIGVIFYATFYYLKSNTNRTPNSTVTPKTKDNTMFLDLLRLIWTWKVSPQSENSGRSRWINVNVKKFNLYPGIVNKFVICGQNFGADKNFIYE